MLASLDLRAQCSHPSTSLDWRSEVRARSSRAGGIHNNNKKCKKITIKCQKIMKNIGKMQKVSEDYLGFLRITLGFSKVLDKMPNNEFIGFLRITLVFPKVLVQILAALRSR